jgi:hypothetical protein
MRFVPRRTRIATPQTSEEFTEVSSPVKMGARNGSRVRESMGGERRMGEILRYTGRYGTDYTITVVFTTSLKDNILSFFKEKFL